MLSVISALPMFFQACVKGLLKCVLTFAVLLGLSLPAYADNKTDKPVLVSVHPLALLIQSAWPNLKVNSLVSANQSPHDFVLKPSDMKRIHSADAVIWMGKEFEPYLTKVLRNKDNVDLASVLDKDDHSEHDHETHAADHTDHAHDPHLWLDPNRIIGMLTLVKQQLDLPQPNTFIRNYQNWLIKAQAALKPRQDVGFVSFHDAFREWVTAFNLNQLMVVTSNPEKPVGTRHVVQVRNVLASGQAACLFVEPQFQSRIVKKLHQGLEVKVVKIDPMASDYAIADGNFMEFYDSLLSNFTQCLNQ